MRHGLAADGGRLGCLAAGNVDVLEGLDAGADERQVRIALL